MEKAKRIFEIKTYILTAIAIISFSQFVGQLFGVTIPNFVWTFFKSFGEIVILAAVFAFAFAWLLKARPHNKPKSYSVVIFDVYGKETQIDGIRREFRTHDVAWSFMKDYKKSYPLHNFALVAEMPKTDKRTIFRYI